MNIGQAAKLSGVSAKTIRYYESIGLIKPALRKDNGYRDYSEKDLRTLNFIQRARSMGFSLTDVADLVGLWQNSARTSKDVKELAQRHIEALDERIFQMQTIRSTLSHLVNCCHGDERPDCPILSDFETGR